MTKHTDRVRLEEIDWHAVFPWLGLFRSFSIAAHPIKLLTSLLLVILLVLVALSIDIVTGQKVHSGELEQYRLLHFGMQDDAAFAKWCETREKASQLALRELLVATPNFKANPEEILKSSDPLAQAASSLHEHYAQAYANLETMRETTGFEKDWEGEFAVIRESRRQALAAVRWLKPQGPMKSSVDLIASCFDRMARSVVTFNFGWSTFSNSPPQPMPAQMFMRADEGSTLIADSVPAAYYDQTTFLAALHDLFVILPSWMWHQHRLPLGLFFAVALVLVALFGGAVARMAALHVTRDERVNLREALRFVVPRAWSFLLAPLAPFVLIAAVGLLMAIGGLIFNLKAMGVDIVAAIFFGIAILSGFIITATLVLTLMGIHLVFPAMAVNGADLFDAIARAFNYVLNRPWRWLFYNVVAILYGSLAYLFVTLLMGGVFFAVSHFVGLWVVSPTDLGDNRWEIMLPLAGAGNDVDYASLDWSGRIAAWVIHLWMCLAASLIGAFVVSYYFSANTWIYTLLRRDADGVEWEDVMIDPPYDPAAVKHRVEEAATTAGNESEEDESE